MRNPSCLRQFADLDGEWNYPEVVLVVFLIIPRPLFVNLLLNVRDLRVG